MEKYYSDEKNAQVVIALLKEHGIRKVVASPGGTNVSIVVSMQNDPFFEMYSSVDERSAAYMACGMAAESEEPVVISCTGATASRNYMPGLTEAYYRKLPILAITSTQNVSKVGHHIAQVIDRSTLPNDVAKLSVSLPIIKDDSDTWECEIKVNQAILELKRHGGGPVHIDLPTIYKHTYGTRELPKVRLIDRVDLMSKFPELPTGRIAVFVGSHPVWTREQTEILDAFCESNNGVVFCDHTSNYKGKYRVLYSIVAGQKMFDHAANRPDVLIHIGEISGDYYSLKNIGKQVWRVNEDGEIRDTFRKLRYVFEMYEEHFFKHYTKSETTAKDSYLKLCKKQFNELHSKIPELPYSNLWLASKLANKMPEESIIHFGILNSLRSWNFYEIPQSVFSASNVGGFGIDGNVSSLLGASLVNKDKLYFGIIGDLAFFYDMNAMGNRHMPSNVRLLLVNNGKGTEFRQYSHGVHPLGDSANQFVAADGHFGNKSASLVKNYAENLGFEYLNSSDKEEFDQVYQRFLNPEKTEKPIILEVFTNSVDESKALEIIMNLEENVKVRAKALAKQALGKKGISTLKKMIRK